MPLAFPQFVLIDKPAGRSSFSVVAQVRRVAGMKRVGHCGTLDPFATGLLIVLVGRQATKHQDEYLHMEKSYDCTAQFGLTSDTYDVTGQVQETASWAELAQLSEVKIRQAMTGFVGEITQQVPAFSAVKRQGQKLYEIARKGELDLSTLPSRKVSILSFELTSLTLDESAQAAVATFSVHCSSGTYIRSLIHDLGQQLGVGAVATELRRTTIGPYSLQQAIDVETLQPEMFKELHEQTVTE